MPVRIFVRTWGCTLNQSDSDIMQALLERSGFKFSMNEEKADVVVLNTCTVKGATENKINSYLKNLIQRGKKVVVAGCLAANYKKIRKIAPRAPIVGTGATVHIGDAVNAALLGQGQMFGSFENKVALPRMMNGPIARIPIEEGCTSRCTFCQTKIARPYLFSYPPKEVVRMVEQAVEKGAKEIQLTGMDSGAYGLDIQTDLVSLLSELVKVEGDFKIRLGMINPQHVKRIRDGLLEIFKNKKMFKFLHMPVQSGSEKVCKDMRRMHTVADFESMVKEFRNEFQDITIATDVIVAYPTESEEDYILTHEMLMRTRPDVINLSRFTPREGTEAKKLKQLDTKIGKERTVNMNALIKRITYENMQKFVGREMNVLILEKGKFGQIKGRTDNYRQVVIEMNNKMDTLGKTVKCKIVKASHSSLFGKMIGKIME